MTEYIMLDLARIAILGCTIYTYDGVVTQVWAL